MPWRENVAYRHDLIRHAALTAIDHNITDLERLVRELRRLIHYREMARNDRASFRQNLCYLRRIVRGWHLLMASDQEGFRTGKIKPWTMTKKIAEAEAAQKSHGRDAPLLEVKTSGVLGLAATGNDPLPACVVAANGQSQVTAGSVPIIAAQG